MRWSWTGLAAAIALVGCTGINPTLDTALAIWKNQAEHQFARGFEYLEVGQGGHKTVMALGSRLHRDGATFEQWFSGQGEMLELRDGRIHRVLGMTSEIRESFPVPPPWSHIQSQESPTSWNRIREVMPGYQRREEHVKSTIKKPVLNGDKIKQSVLISEEVVSTRVNGRPWHYVDHFELIGLRIVTSEQCIGPDLCLKLKPLGVVNP